MPRTTLKAATRHNNYTTEAYREIVEAALEELVENSGTLETLDLIAWNKALTRKIGHVSDRAGADIEGAPVARYGAGDE